MSDTALILPAAGVSSRMRLPYPKELIAVGESMLLIDNSLIAAAAAGIEAAYIVVTYDKLRLVSSLLGPTRHGLKMSYVMPDPKDHNSDAGSAFRGCRRALLADQYKQFLIIAPDSVFPRLDVQLMLGLKCPSAMIQEKTGQVFMSLLDDKTLNKLRRRLAAVSEDEPQSKKQGLLSRLITEDISQTRLVWETVKCDEKSVDVNTWADLERSRS